MSESRQTLIARANKLRRQIAEGEAGLEGLKAKLAAIEAKLNKKPVPISSTEVSAPVDEIAALWKAALPTARTRSSKHLCRKAWNMTPKGERPTVEEMVAALKVWNRCPEWRADGNKFVPGLHKWINERRWEDLPESSTSDGLARYRSVPKPLPQHDPSEEITDRAEIAAFLSLKPGSPPRMKS